MKRYRVTIWRRHSQSLMEEKYECNELGDLTMLLQKGSRFLHPERIDIEDRARP